MVLIDPSVEFLDTAMRRLKTPDEVRQYDSLFVFGRDPLWPEKFDHEADYQCERNHDERQKDHVSRRSGNRITVINMPESGHSFLRGTSKIKADLHHRWTVESPRVYQVLAEKCGHYVHHDDPALVIDEIKAMLKEAK